MDYGTGFEGHKMATPLSPTKLLDCGRCGASLPLGNLQPGQKCRCGKCGQILVVPGGQQKTPSQAEPLPPIGFNCTLCDTRLSAPAKHTGRKVRCPDCGRANTVPPPPKPTAPKIPEAMFGEQYGLWGVDEAPSNEELVALQPQFFPVYCRVCNQMMQARHEQAGGAITCPECGAETRVPPPPQEKHEASVLVPEGAEYQLDESEVPPERPSYVPFQVKQLEEKEQREQEQQERIYENRELPQLPLLQGVMGMLFRSPLPALVFVLAFALALESWFIANAMANVQGMALMVVLVAYGTTAVMGLFIVLGASAGWLAVLKESSEGNDKLYDPPGLMFLEWAGEGFFVVFSSALAVAPGMLLWHFIPGLPTWIGVAAAAGGWFLLFPVLLLSQLQNGSPLEVFSPQVFGSLFRCLGPWAYFYVEALLAIGGIGAAVASLQMLSSLFLPVSVGLISFGTFLYFRLLGRLAWWLAERLPADGPEGR